MKVKKKVKKKGKVCYLDEIGSLKLGKSLFAEIFKGILKKSSQRLSALMGKDINLMSLASTVQEDDIRTIRPYEKENYVVLTILTESCETFGRCENIIYYNTFFLVNPREKEPVKWASSIDCHDRSSGRCIVVSHLDSQKLKNFLFLFHIKIEIENKKKKRIEEIKVLPLNIVTTSDIENIKEAYRNLGVL